jgi:hypothetical protein
MSLASAGNGFSILRHRNFAFSLSARVLGTVAVLMQSVATALEQFSAATSLGPLADAMANGPTVPPGCGQASLP